MVVFKFIPGDQVYVFAPVTDNNEDCPLQIDAELAVKIGKGLTMTVEMANCVHPNADPTTV